MLPLDAFKRASAQNGIILDTNLIIVFFVGLYRPDLIPSCKRTSAYTVDDFRYICNIIKQSKNIIVTPQILTELSNHTFDRLFDEPGFSEYFAHIHRVISASEESHAHKDILLNNKMLSQIGFADTSIIEAAKTMGCAVLTDDSKLTAILSAQNYPNLNINVIRTYQWFNEIPSPITTI